MPLIGDNKKIDLREGCFRIIPFPEAQFLRKSDFAGHAFLGLGLTAVGNYFYPILGLDLLGRDWP